MNNAEVQHLVEVEIASRYRRLDDTVRGDWVRAVWKSGDLDTARQIVRELVDNPDATLAAGTPLVQAEAAMRARLTAMGATNIVEV